MGQVGVPSGQGVSIYVKGYVLENKVKKHKL